MFVNLPVLSLILKKTLPLTVGVFAIFMVQLVDAVFLGMLGTNTLTVQGLTQPFYMVLIGIQVGIGIAATSIISRANGAKQRSTALMTASASVVFGTCFIALVCLMFWLFRDYAFAVFISDEFSPDTAQELAVLFYQYWPIWLMSTVAGAAMYLVSSVYRANEDTKTPGLTLVMASVINLILDPILIFVLDFGMNGAAMASMTAFAISFCWLLYGTRTKDWFGRIQPGPALANEMGLLIRLALPAMANQLLPSICSFITLLLLARLGDNGIAFWSLLTRVEMLLLIFALAMTMAIPPMIGRYLGEGRHEAIAELLQTAAKFLIGFHVLMGLLLALGSGLVVNLIVSDPALTDWMAFALRTITFSYGPLGLCMLVVSSFNAFQLPKKAMLISVVRLFVLYVPAVLIGTQTDSITNTVVAAAVANTLSGIFAWLALKKHMRQAFGVSETSSSQV